jgi:Kef-type K+ transport system membrane component KefB
VIGVALHDDRRFVEEWKRRVSPIVWVFFLPIFFAYTGLRTDVGTIRGWPGATTLLLVLAVAFVSKFGGAYVAARLVGEGHRSALTIGVCMNVLVIMALVSTFMATPLIRWLMGSERSLATPLGEPSATRATM